MSALGNENKIDNENTNNIIIITINDAKLYVPIVTLSVRENEKSWKLFSKGFERPVYWNEYKTKNENKNKANELRYFLGSS